MRIYRTTIAVAAAFAWSLTTTAQAGDWKRDEILSSTVTAEWNQKVEEYIATTSPDDWERVVSGLLVLSPEQSRAIDLAIECSKIYNVELTGRSYSTPYDKQVLRLGRAMAKRNADMAYLYHEVLEATIRHAGDILEQMPLGLSKSGARTFKEAYLQECRIKGIQATARSGL